MMPLDPNIALQVRPIQMPDRVGQMAQALALRNEGDRGELQTLQLTKARKDMEDEDRVNNMIAGAGSTEEAIKRLQQSGNLRGITAGATLEKTLQERAKAAAELAKLNGENIDRSLKLHRDQLAAVTNPEQAAQWVAAGYQDPALGPLMERTAGPLQAVLQRIPTDPEGFQRWKMQNGLGIEKFMEMTKPVLGSRDTGSEIQETVRDPITGRLTVVGTTQKTVTPGEALTDNRTRSEGALNRGVTLRGQNLTDARERLATNLRYDQLTQQRVAGAQAAGRVAGETQAQAAANLPNVTASAEQGIDVINQMIGGLTLQKGKVVLPAGAEKPHAGFSVGVGASAQPGFQYVPGTDKANFYALMDQVRGGAFLQAFNSLKGGGQITEIEGKKATDAITRLSTTQSEAEFVKAARELQDILRKGVQRAQQQAAGRPGAPAGGGIKFLGFENE